MESYIIHLVICSPLHVVCLRFMLVHEALVCSVFLYMCTPLGLPRGFPHLDSHQRSQGYSCLSWADTHTCSQAEDQPRSKKTEQNGPRASTLHPSPGSMLRAVRAWPAPRSRASTLEREQGYHSLFHHHGLFFWVANSLDRLTKLEIPFPTDMQPQRPFKLIFRLPRLGSGYTFL